LRLETQDLCHKTKTRLLAYSFIVFENAKSIFCTSVNKLEISSKSLSLIHFSFCAIISCVSVSYAEPNAMAKKYANSFFPPLPEPSAIFDATETDAFLI
jgi:hypothetical protein